jgi:2-deoxy-D-gluconate 3-dehydrogenase
VTGASRGIGQAIALAFAREGAHAVGVDIGDQSETGAKAKALGAKFNSYTEDFGKLTRKGAAGLIAKIIKDAGRVDILVNNAGIIRRAPALDFSEDDWDEVLQINLKVVFFLSQAVGRTMISNGGGKIINIASMLSYQGGIIVPSYTASKSAVAGVTRALANEWSRHGINVNAIAPGYMATDNTAALRADPDRSSTILDRIPAGRWGTPDDLKGAVVFLASPAASYLHGAILPVDGGWLAR